MRSCAFKLALALSIDLDKTESDKTESDKIESNKTGV
jgi:hypothetical protein